MQGRQETYTWKKSPLGTKGRIQGDLILARDKMQSSLLKKCTYSSLTGSRLQSSSADVATTWVSMGFLTLAAVQPAQNEETEERGS